MFTPLSPTPPQKKMFFFTVSLSFTQTSSSYTFTQTSSSSYAFTQTSSSSSYTFTQTSTPVSLTNTFRLSLVMLIHASCYQLVGHLFFKTSEKLNSSVSQTYIFFSVFQHCISMHLFFSQVFLPTPT